MLAIAKLALGQGSYYERSVDVGFDDSYAGRGESPGIWTGRGAAELELEGVVSHGQLGALILGLDPLTENRLRRHWKARLISVERINPLSGERRVVEKKLAPVAGFDLVFSVPKSISLLHALGDEETRRAVSEAHLSAWQAALGYLEEEACVVRRGKNGVIREQGEGFVAAAYQHSTSRALDPHLHTHVIVANMARSPSDGKWRALDGQGILRNYRLAAGYLHGAHLRFELSRSLGVEWDVPVKGLAELKAVSRVVIEEFSTRQRQLVEQMREKGSAGFYAAQFAAVQTRQPKRDVDLAELREEWRARAAEHGLGRRGLAELLQRSRWREPSSVELRGIAKRLLGPNGLTERRTVFSEPEVVMAWAGALAQGASVSRIRELAAGFTTLDDVESVGASAVPGRPSRFSTAELIQTEKRALAVAERGVGAGPPRVSEEIVRQSVAGRDGVLLSAEQEAMVRTVCASRDRVVCVVGLPGSGKTTATHAVAEAFWAAGVPVLGAAPSGVAAENLEDATGIRSTTLHGLIRESEAGLPEGSLLVVDEVGTAETRILAPLLERVEQANGKALLIGDPHQLRSVGAGWLFAGLVERHGAIELTENRRQHDGTEREALVAVRGGRGRGYVAFADGNDRLVVSEDPAGVRARLLADWWNTAREDLAGSVMIALRRTDVSGLNAAARDLMNTNGRLGQDRLRVAGREFVAGDRIVCRLNDTRLGVKNGTRGTVEAVDQRKRLLVVATDRGDRVKLTERYLAGGHVSHGYALSGHSGQGMTVERAYVLGAGQGRLREWGHVALPRARKETRVYLTASDLERESHFREADRRNPRSDAHAFEESAIEKRAVDQGLLPRRPKPQARVELTRSEETDERRERYMLHGRQRRALIDARTNAEQKLAQARQELKELGRFGRGKRKDALRSQIALHNAAIVLADARLAELENRSRDERQIASDQRRALARTRAGHRLALSRPETRDPAIVDSALRSSAQ